jgi:hypothetical protein
MVQEPLSDVVLLEMAAYTARRMHEYLARGRGARMEGQRAATANQAQQSLADLLARLHEETAQK